MWAPSRIGRRRLRLLRLRTGEQMLHISTTAPHGGPPRCDLENYAPSPSGLTSGMAGCVIPSASPRATPRRPEGRALRRRLGGCVEGCPRDAARSVTADGMTHKPQRCLAEQTRNVQSERNRHVLVRASNERAVQAAPGGTARRHLSHRVRLHTEEVTGRSSVAHSRTAWSEAQRETNDQAVLRCWSR